MSIQVSNLTFSYADRTLLKDVNFAVHESQKIGLVGHNGTGKSTLFRLFMDEIHPEEGSVRVDGTIALVPQEVKRDPVMEASATVHEYINPDGTYALHEINKLIVGLGMPDIVLESSPQEYSGGVKTKLALVRALIAEPDILLLDEPTNFMDLEGKKWVMGLLSQYPKTLILISHDIGLMDRAIDRVLSVNPHTHAVDEYKGNYSQYLRLQKEAETLFKKQVHGQERKIAGLERALKVVGVKTRIVMQKRVARLKDKLPDLPPEIRKIKMRLPEPARVGEIPIQAKGLMKSFDTLKILDGVDFTIRRGERIVILGANGSGKSTLIKILIGNIAPDTGEIQRSQGLKIGYYNQEFEDFDMSQTVLQTFMDRCDKMESNARPHLGRFNFAGSKVFQPVGSLSGGEKTRLSIAILCGTDANLLVLDEPTTYLDVLSQRIILDALKSYTGTMIVVSHTEQFVSELTPHKAFLMPSATMDYWDEKYLKRVEVI